MLQKALEHWQDRKWEGGYKTGIMEGGEAVHLAGHLFHWIEHNFGPVIAILVVVTAIGGTLIYTTH